LRAGGGRPGGSGKGQDLFQERRDGLLPGGSRTGRRHRAQEPGRRLTVNAEHTRAPGLRGAVRAPTRPAARLLAALLAALAALTIAVPAACAQAAPKAAPLPAAAPIAPDAAPSPSPSPTDPGI